MKLVHLNIFLLFTTVALCYENNTSLQHPLATPPLPESIKSLFASGQDRIRCLMISTADIAYICEHYSKFYADKADDSVVVPLITCSKSSPIVATITASVALVRHLGSCNWINMYIQWSTYWSLNHASDTDLHAMSSNSVEFQRTKRRIIDFENDAWKPQLTPRKIQVSGSHFKLAGITVPPLIIFKKNTYEIEGGTFPAFFSTIGNYYNFTFQIDTNRFKEQGQGRKSANGTWSGVIGGLVRKEFDATFMGHQVSRYPYLFHSIPLYYDEAGFVVAQPAVHVSWYALVTPFTPLLWLFSFVALVAQMVTCYVILSVRIKMGQEHEQTKGNLIWNSWDIPYTICVEQGPDIPNCLIKLVLLWSVAWMIVTSGYKDKLLATLTFPELNFVPTKLRDLNEHPEYRILLEGFLISFRLNHSKNPDIEPLKHRLVLQDPKAVNSTKCVLAATTEENTVCMGFKPFLLMAVATNATINDDYVTSVMSDDILPQVHISVGLQKHSTVAVDFERMSSSYKESFLYEKSKESVMTTYKKIGKNWLNQGNPELQSKLQNIMDAQNGGLMKLTNRHFLVVYIFYVVSMPIATFVFAFELHIRKNHKNPSTNCSEPQKNSEVATRVDESQEEKCSIVEVTENVTILSEDFNTENVDDD